MCCRPGGIQFRWISKKRRTLFDFDVALLRTSVTKQKQNKQTKQKKKNHTKLQLVLICCLLTLEEPVHSTKTSYCLASYHRSSAVLSSLLRLQNQPCRAKAKQPSEGFLSLHVFWCTSTITLFFILMRCPAPSHFWYNVSRAL